MGTQTSICILDHPEGGLFVMQPPHCPDTGSNSYKEHTQQQSIE